MSNEFKQKNCRYCETELPEPFLELGSMALANSYIPLEKKNEEEFACPLSLTLCPKCFLVQLSHVVPPEKMFSHYLYVSSTTKTFRDHFASYAKEVNSRLKIAKKPLAVDIGSNDGLLVQAYTDEGMDSFGIDPATNLAEEANKNGRRTINKFFDSSCVDEILKEFGEADVISGNNVFAHIHDSRSVCLNVKKLLSKKGIFVLEFPYLPVMVEKLLFDMIYHEHLSYIALNPLQSFLSQFEMHAFDVLLTPAHGGSLRVFIQHNDGPYEMNERVPKMITEEREKGYLGKEIYETFSKNVLQVKNDFAAKVHALKQNGKSISGYGAPAKCSTICNFYGLDAALIDFIIDDNPLKQNHLVPGAKIPIVASDFLNQNPTDTVIIFAWNFAKEILKKIGLPSEKGVQFLLPVPNPDSKEVTFDIKVPEKV